MKNKTCFCGITERCGYQIETDMEQHDKVIYEQGYNKAIDDFAEKLYERCDSMINNEWNKGVAPISWANAYADFKDDVEEIAEQLKTGGIDGNERTDT